MLVNITTVVSLFGQTEVTIVPVKGTLRSISKSYQRLATKQTRNPLFLSISGQEPVTVTE